MHRAESYTFIHVLSLIVQYKSEVETKYARREGKARVGAVQRVFVQEVSKQASMAQISTSPTFIQHSHNQLPTLIRAFALLIYLHKRSHTQPNAGAGPGAEAGASQGAGRHGTQDARGPPRVFAGQAPGTHVWQQQRAVATFEMKRAV